MADLDDENEYFQRLWSYDLMELYNSVY